MMGVRNDNVRLIRLPGDVDETVMLEVTSELEAMERPSMRDTPTVVLVCDAEQGELTEASYDCARRLLVLRKNSFPLLTVVGRYAPPAAMLLFVCGRRRVMQAHARIGFREVQWRDPADRVSALQSRVDFLSGQGGAFCDVQAGKPSTYVSMVASNQGELLLKAADESRLLTKEARSKRVTRIAEAKERLADLEPRQEKYKDLLARATGDVHWKSPRYWGSKVQVAGAVCCVQYQLAHMAYDHPMAWMNEMVRAR